MSRGPLRARIDSGYSGHDLERIPRCFCHLAAEQILRAAPPFPAENEAIRGYVMRLATALSLAATVLIFGSCLEEAKAPNSNQPSLPIKLAEQNGDKSSARGANVKSHEDRKAQSDPKAISLYRQAQALFKAGKHEEGYEAAKEALAQFIEEDFDLAWMLLETVTSDGRRIDIHFNMGPRERKPPRIGIVRPLSFRVQSIDDNPRILEIIDFEISYFDGKPLTAAIGKTDRGSHVTFVLLPIDASYETIKKKAIDVIDRRTDNRK
jgi:hypothetical protein